MTTSNSADIVLRNATIRTMDNVDISNGAVAIAGQHILAVGSDVEIMALATADTKVIDAQGGTVLPGFFESHMHLFEGGMSLQRLDVAKVFGAAALSDAVVGFANKNPDEPLLVAFGANYTMFGEDTRIDRHLLDAAISDRPFYMIATDFHTAWANTIALKKAGILQGRDVGANAEIVMGDDQLATGELREDAAMATIMCLQPGEARDTLGMSGQEPKHVTDAERESDMAVLSSALNYCARHGITSIINMDGNKYQLELLRALEKRDQLPCRVEVPNRVFEEGPEDPVQKALDMTREFKSDKLRCGRLKLFMDGVFDNWTAVILDDYADRAGNRGVPIVTAERFNEICIDADKHGLQISVHAVGDGAVRMVLDGYEAAQKANGHRDSRHRVEHIDTIHPDDVPRLNELGVIASMQPVHPPGSAGLPLEPTTTIMGRHRWPYAFNWRMIADTGATICFATDWPISPIDPLYAINCALTRQPWDDDLPDPRLSLEECLLAYTKNGAYAAFDENRLGRVEAGMLADLVVIRGDLETLHQGGPLQVESVLTICDGKITYQLSQI